MTAANEALNSAIMASGSTLIIKLAQGVKSLKDQDSQNDLIGTLLEVACSMGQGLLYTSLAIIEAIIDQQWMQVFLIATLPKTLEGIIQASPVKEILEKLLTLAVPILNKASDASAAGKKDIRMGIGTETSKLTGRTKITGFGVSWNE